MKQEEKTCYSSNGEKQVFDILFYVFHGALIDRFFYVIIDVSIGIVIKAFHIQIK